MQNILISFVGDISLNGKYNDMILNKSPNFPFEQIKSKFDASDIVMGNLESPFVPGDSSPEFSMKTPLEADPKYVEGLKWAGFDILNLSNNHILDYGESRALATQTILNNQDIEHFGYGKDSYSAKKMKVLFLNSLRIGFVGYTDVIIDSPFYASECERGIAKFEIDCAIKDTLRNKKLVDILVVNLHWGIEYFHLPTPEQVAYARELIDSGADIVIGHHPHTLQGIARYKHGIIAYSLGNFVFADIKWEWVAEEEKKRITNYNFSRRHRDSIILQVIIKDKDNIDYKIIGTCISKSGQVIADNKRSVKRVGSLSRLLSRQDYNTYFQRELRLFQKRQLIKQVASRFKRIQKIKSKHLKEFRNILCRWLQLK